VRAPHAPGRRRDDEDGGRGDETGLCHDRGCGGARGVEVGAAVAARAPVDPHLHRPHHRRREAPAFGSQVRPPAPLRPPPIYNWFGASFFFRTGGAPTPSQTERNGVKTEYIVRLVVGIICNLVRDN
jgi:hypothetical protein